MVIWSLEDMSGKENIEILLDASPNPPIAIGVGGSGG
jgi:hypothetical protein